ncbi:DUF742 domain-containing protein [Streptomyces sp. NPDC004134]|uniref:DUF742 domain-containing protein n=1 Tax=Streptomyces sp. NPDC004134 TaxID=3364691 RepID=UPI00367A277D
MTSYDDAPWVEDGAPRLRPYAVTGGRTTPTRRLALETLVMAARTLPRVALTPEHDETLRECRAGPRSVAEVAGRLGLPVAVTKILLCDLLDTCALILTAPAGPPDPTDPYLLEKVLVGLRNL